MGCLYVDVATPLPCTLHIVEDLNETLEASVIKDYSDINVEATSVLSNYSVNLSNRNTGVYVNTVPKNVSTKVIIALVCRISEGEWLYLHVEEGNIITIDGQFMKVLRG